MSEPPEKEALAQCCNKGGTQLGKPQCDTEEQLQHGCRPPFCFCVKIRAFPIPTNSSGGSASVRGTQAAGGGQRKRDGKTVRSSSGNMALQRQAIWSKAAQERPEDSLHDGGRGILCCFLIFRLFCAQAARRCSADPVPLI